ncbi:MAG TPA: purine-nucleoside phosphorylase [Erysipelothrix sp.]|nr:purine-nucleoside phosphorylase [Erysipelothrix sp.]
MFYDKVLETTKFIQERVTIKPQIGIILGSGLSSLVDHVKNPIELSYQDIPNFPVSEIVGHAGKLVFGTTGNKEVMLMAGRFHFYEGFDMKEVTYPLFVMKLLGVEKLIVTNSCGGINTDFKPGDLMIITDFINGVSTNPLRGVNDERFGPRFPDMSDPYTTRFRDRAKLVANELNIDYKEGVYAFFQGPYYETVSEIEMYTRLGADAIGMSTVPETIVANYLGFDVLGISCITNMATGLRDGKHSHQEVVEIARKSSQTLVKWVEKIIESDS